MAATVLNTPELLEAILMAGDPKDLIDHMQVKTLREAVEASPSLLRKLYLRQLLERPVFLNPWDKDFESSIWEPNRILCPQSYTNFLLADQPNVGWQICLKDQTVPIAQPPQAALQNGQQYYLWKRSTPCKTWYSYGLTRYDLNSKQAQCWGPVLPAEYLSMYLSDRNTPVTIQIHDDGPYQPDYDPSIAAQTKFDPSTFRVSRHSLYSANVWVAGNKRFGEVIDFVEAWKKANHSSWFTQSGFYQFWEQYSYVTSIPIDEVAFRRRGKWVVDVGGQWRKPLSKEGKKHDTLDKDE